MGDLIDFIVDTPLKVWVTHRFLKMGVGNNTTSRYGLNSKRVADNPSSKTSYMERIMLKKTIIVLGIVFATLIWSSSVSYDQCVQRCKQAYQGNPKAIQACIDRCR